MRQPDNFSSKKKTKRYLNESLLVYQIKFACIHGGKTHIPKGVGIRNKKTFRKEILCPASILLRADESGNKLIVVKIENKHNHIINKILFDHLPHQRTLDSELREEAKRLLKIKANKCMIREHLEEKSSKVITLKDLSNLQQDIRKSYQNDLANVCSKINNKFGADCHLLVNTEDCLMGLLFCTPSMQQTMNAFPELVCIDATYKLTNIRAPVYIIHVEDGCGESEVVAVGLLVTEDKDSIRWLLKNFKELNPSCNKIRNIMSDKDWTEREILAECFPQAQILLCIFHVFKIFNREITTENMKITNSERTQALQLLQDLVYAASINEFEKIKNKIEAELSVSIINYLKKNWLGISEEWCPLLGEKILNFMNTTNNRLEGINSKLKSVVSLNSPLE